MRAAWYESGGPASEVLSVGTNGLLDRDRGVYPMHVVQVEWSLMQRLRTRKSASERAGS